MKNWRAGWAPATTRVAAALAVSLSAAWAQPAAPAQPAARAKAAQTTTASAPSAAAVAKTGERATSELRVIEDDQVRIEETRVRGQLQRITVAPKGPVGSTLRPYEINVGAGGRDPSQDKSAAGQRVWSVLKF
jgi:hypothetical protein